jgi:hypothetical protein
MNTTITARAARYIVLPVFSAGIIGGATLGLAGIANAAPSTVHPEPRPGIVATPEVKAKPAPEALPGWRWHHGHKGGNQPE